MYSYLLLSAVYVLANAKIPAATTSGRASVWPEPGRTGPRGLLPFWSLSWDGKRLLARIPRAAFGRQFFILRQVAGARPRGGSVVVGTENTSADDAGELTAGDHVFRWQSGPGDSVTLVPFVRDTSVRESGPGADPLTFSIVHRDAEGTIIADVDPFFLGHWRDGPPTLHSGTNHLEIDASEMMGDQQVVWHWTIALLPDVPMRPRFRDPRIGFFASAETAGDSCTLSAKTYIVRWRLDKRDSTAVVSEVVHSIVFYIDPATPREFVPWIQRGVEEWLPAFDAIGLRHALVVREAPSPSDSAQWSLADVSHNVIYWGTDRGATEGIAKPVIDPRSGEIVHATIVLYGGNLPFVWQSLGDTARVPFGDSVAGPLLQAMVAHEVGHVLGLSHNFEDPYPRDSLRSVSFVRHWGVTASVMGFQLVDRDTHSSDHVPLRDLFNRVGSYDRFAIAWGYRPIATAPTPAAERPLLQRWQTVQDTARYLQTTVDSSICRSPDR